jgi:cytochrome P450
MMYSSAQRSFSDSRRSRFAGSGTTANTFAYLFWELSRNPDVQKKLYDELKMNAEVDGGAYLTYQVSRRTQVCQENIILNGLA